MSYNEYNWWICRSSIKPLRSDVEDINLYRLINQSSYGFDGKPRVRAQDAAIDWYKDNSAESWKEAAKIAKEKQQTLNKKKSNG